jgi:hypothetical protein
MNYLRTASVVCFVFALAACGGGSDLAEKYHLDKKYWDVSDYEGARYYINGTPADEKKPCFDSPDKAAVFKKIIDKNNVSVVVEDDALGLSHRAEFAEGIFHQMDGFAEQYSGRDREDKFIYPMELVELLKFSLYVQNPYFELGNQEILKNSDNPQDPATQNIVRRNQQTLISNYCIYLNYIKHEKSFSAEALTSYVAGINEYFPALIDMYPQADYTELKNEITNMQAKSESPEVQKALTDLLAKIESVKNPSVTVTDSVPSVDSVPAKQ